jgi:hypothetical protein
LPFFKRRVREIAHVLRAYARLYLQVQELWLETRIRRDEYAFLGDLRKLAARSMQEAKLNWTRVHAAIAARLGPIQAQLGSRGAALSSTMIDRLDALREAAGSRASLWRDSMTERAGTVRARVDATLQNAGRDLRTRFQLAQAALADLRLSRLPPRPSRPKINRRLSQPR